MEAALAFIRTTMISHPASTAAAVIFVAVLVLILVSLLAFAVFRGRRVRFGPVTIGPREPTPSGTVATPSNLVSRPERRRRAVRGRGHSQPQRDNRFTRAATRRRGRSEEPARVRRRQRGEPRH